MTMNIELVSIAAATKALGATQARPVALAAATAGAAYRVAVRDRTDAPGPQDDASTFPGWSSVFVAAEWVAPQVAGGLDAVRRINADTPAPAPPVVSTVWCSIALVDAAGLADLP